MRQQYAIRPQIAFALNFEILQDEMKTHSNGDALWVNNAYRLWINCEITQALDQLEDYQLPWINFRGCVIELNHSVPSDRNIQDNHIGRLHVGERMQRFKFANIHCMMDVGAAYERRQDLRMSDLQNMTDHALKNDHAISFEINAVVRFDEDDSDDE